MSDLEGIPSYFFPEDGRSSPSPPLTDTRDSTASTSPILTPTPSRRLSCSLNTTLPTTPDFRYSRTSPRSLRRLGFIDPPQRIPNSELEPVERPVFKLSPQRPSPTKSIPKPRPEWNNHFNSVNRDKQTSLKDTGMSTRARTPSLNSLDWNPIMVNSVEPKGGPKRKESSSNDLNNGSGDIAQVEQLQRKIAKLRDRIDLEMEKRDTIERNLMIELASRKRFEAECRGKDLTIRELRIMLRQKSQKHENLVMDVDRRERDFTQRLQAEREIRVHLENQIKQLASMLAPEVMIKMLEEQIEVLDVFEDVIKPDSL